jgi:rhodanese-related sulfurtransferase
LVASYNTTSMSNIRPKELDERLGSKPASGPFVLDIRPATAFESVAIDRSHNVPVYDELRRGDESALRDRLGEIPADRDVVVVCKMGVVAKRATSVLRDEGYDALTLRGGMSGWRGYQEGSLGYKLRALRWRFM